jgi:prolipoprotein diacylglyceryltransferase
MASHFVWNIDPEILRLGPLAIRWYGVLFASGFMLGYFVLLEMYRRERRSEENLPPLLSYILFGAVIGARLGHVLFISPITTSNARGKSP